MHDGYIPPIPLRVIYNRRYMLASLAINNYIFIYIAQKVYVSPRQTRLISASEEAIYHPRRSRVLTSVL